MKSTKLPLPRAEETIITIKLCTFDSQPFAARLIFMYPHAATLTLWEFMRKYCRKSILKPELWETSYISAHFEIIKTTIFHNYSRTFEQFLKIEHFVSMYAAGVRLIVGLKNET